VLESICLAAGINKSAHQQAMSILSVGTDFDRSLCKLASFGRLCSLKFQLGEPDHCVDR
jgi:hypothetical protein